MTAFESLRLGFAFGLGTATFFAPCAFPLLPGYVAYFLGTDGGDAQATALPARLLRAVGVALLASLGFLVVYVALTGVVFAVGTQVLADVSVLELVVGVLLVGLGGAMALGRQPTGFVRVALPERRRGPLGYFAFGVVYAAAAAGCTAPLFVGVAGIALSAGPVGAVATLGAYAAGMAVLLTAVTLLTALGRETLLRRLIPDSGLLARVAGVVLVLAGVVQLYFFVFVFDGLASL